MRGDKGNEAIKVLKIRAVPQIFVFVKRDISAIKTRKYEVLCVKYAGPICTLYFEDHVLAFGAEREVDEYVKPQRFQRANSLRLLGLLWTQCSKLVQEIALKHTCTLVRLQGYSKANYNGKT